MAFSLPPWAPYAIAGGVGLLVLSAVIGGPADDELTPAQRRARDKRVAAARVAEVDRLREIRRLDERLGKSREKVEAKARRARDVAERRAEKARTRADAKGTATAAKQVESAEAKVDRIAQLQSRIESGNLSGSEIKELMASGTLRLRNPDGSWFEEPSETGTALAKAQAMAEQFHGPDDGKYEIVELDASERKPISRYGVVLGKLADLSYIPSEHSDRGGAIWDHEVSDRGDFAPKADRRALLVADPITRQVHIVQNKAAMKFDPLVGIVG